MSGNPSDRPAAADTRRTMLAQLRAGEASGWNRLLLVYKPLLCHWAGRAGVRPQDFDDVCQDVYRVVAARIGGFESTHPHGFRGWLRAITRNVCRERGPWDAAGGTDAAARLAAVPAPDDDDPPAEVAGLYHRVIGLVRGEFSDAHWRVFEELTVAGRPAAEVAGELGLKVANVRAIKSRVYRRIREELGEVGPGPAAP